MSPRTRSQLWRTQNAIADPSLAAKLVRLSQVGPRDVAYDLGAGSGVLTAALARRGSRVIAIERDPALVRRLRRRFHDVPNVVVREGDILAYRFPRSDYVIVANPPFDITADLVRKLREVNVPVGPINDLHEVFTDPVVRHLGLIAEVDHPTAGRVRAPGIPVRLSGTPPSVRSHPPLLGEHTDQILEELGFTSAEVAKLRADGAV